MSEFKVTVKNVLENSNYDLFVGNESIILFLKKAAVVPVQQWFQFCIFPQHTVCFLQSVVKNSVVSTLPREH